MRTYLDASVLVALLTPDALTVRAEAFFRRHRPIPVVSDFAAAEFASSLGRRVRTGEIDKAAAQTFFGDLDQWLSRVAERISLDAAAVADAEGFLRRLDLTLRTPDALNIALCRGAGAVLLTFDEKMADAAHRLSVPVMTG